MHARASKAPYHRMRVNTDIKCQWNVGQKMLSLTAFVEWKEIMPRSKWICICKIKCRFDVKIWTGYKFTGTPITPVIHIQTILGEQNYCACPVRTVIGVYMQILRCDHCSLNYIFAQFWEEQPFWHKFHGIPIPAFHGPNCKFMASNFTSSHWLLTPNPNGVKRVKYECVVISVLFHDCVYQYNVIYFSTWLANVWGPRFSNMD